MSETNQPVYKCIANLGDRSPIDYGGYFVYVDTTGVYPPQATLLETVEHESGKLKWVEYRFDLDKCTFIDGVLSDNQFHPEHAAWFAKPETEKLSRPQDSTYLSCVADDETSLEGLRLMFCSDNPVERAHAYRAVGEYHGFNNFDSYPLTHTSESEVTERFKQTFDELKAIGGNI